MDSNFHKNIDFNEDQNYRAFSSLHHNHLQQHLYHHQAPFDPSSLTSPSFSYLPFLINSHQDQVEVGYNNNSFHGFLDPHTSQLLKTKQIVSNGEASSSDQMVPKKETRLKLKIRKKVNHQDPTYLPQYPTKHEKETNSLNWISSKEKMMKRKAMITTTENNKQQVNNNQSTNLSNLDEDHLKKISTNQYDNENGYNGSNNCVIRICSDCNTTKTPLWRSGPRGPKSLCNACGIRQRKARQAAMAATTVASDMSSPLLKKKMKNKNKRSNEDYNISSCSAPKVICKRMTTLEEAAIAGNLETKSKPTTSSSSSNKIYYDDLAIILSKSSAYQQVFPQDEKDAAILLMALSYGMVHG